MKKSFYATVGAAAALGLFAASLAWGQAVPVPLVSSIGSTDLVHVIPLGQPSAQNFYAPAPLLGNYGPTQPGNNPENALIGGDATTNLWQRGTSGSSVTTTLTYGGPDRWSYWSGTSTAMTVSRSSTAADLPAQYQYGFKMARTSGQTGVVQICMMQQVESANSFAFAGGTAEIDFHAATGATFSAASSNMTVVLISGTGTDQASSTAAFNYNAGGGGSSLWTGQVNTAVTVSLGAVSTLARYTVAIPVPATASELAVALCFTPVGTAGANDYVTFSGIQLTRNSALTTLAGSTGIALPANDNRAKAFRRRSFAEEVILQQRYFYRITESTTTIFERALCAVSTTSLAVCEIKFPVTMRVAPTMTYTAGFALTGSAQTGANVCAINRTSTTLTGAAASTEKVPVDCTSSAAFGAAGTVAQLYDLGTGSSTGVISASAEF